MDSWTEPDHIKVQGTDPDRRRHAFDEEVIIQANLTKIAAWCLIRKALPVLLVVLPILVISVYLLHGPWPVIGGTVTTTPIYRLYKFLKGKS